MKISSSASSKSSLWRLLLCLLAFRCVSGAQCTQQPPTLTDAVPSGVIVYYDISDPSLRSIPAGSSGPTPYSQIQAAFSAWSTTNSSSGGSGTQFVQADSTHQATVFVKADPSYQGSRVAQTAANQNEPIDAANPATITFFPNSLLPNSNTNAYQVTQPGYDTAYLQAALHEIGHVMGIGDYDPLSSAPAPSPTSSVLQPFYGVNDIWNAYQRTAPSDCDKSQAANTSAMYGGGGGGGTGSGGSGGSGGGDGGNCQAYVDYSDPDNPVIAEQCFN